MSDVDPPPQPSDAGHWRRQLQEAMREAAEREAGERDSVGRFNYRWEHVSAVVSLAMRLAALTGADGDVVEAAAWLHDIAKEAGRDHPAHGAAFARRFLPGTDFPAAKIDAVARTIEDHMGLWRDTPLETLESQVLWDADKLSKIGLTAAIHWSGMQLSAGNIITTSDLIAFGRNADWQLKTVRSMHTDPARRAAMARFVAYNELWDRLEEELRGADLG